MRLQVLNIDTGFVRMRARALPGISDARVTRHEYKRTGASLFYAPGASGNRIYKLHLATPTQASAFPDRACICAPATIPSPVTYGPQRSIFLGSDPLSWPGIKTAGRTLPVRRRAHQSLPARWATGFVTEAFIGTGKSWIIGRRYAFVGNAARLHELGSHTTR